MLLLIWCYLPIILIAWNFFLIKKKRTSILYEFERGWFCHSCKEEFDLEIDKKVSSIFGEKRPSLCLSCSRTRKFFNLKYSFLKFRWIVQDYIIFNFKKITYFFVIPVFVLIALHTILLLFGVKTLLPWFYGGINLLFWGLFTWRNYYTTTKKPSDII